MRTLRFLLRKEYLQIFRDRTMLVQIVMIPIIQLLVLANAATFEVRSAQMFVVDLDHSARSRELVQGMAASRRFVIGGATGSMDVADRALLTRRTSAIVRIPADF